MVRIGLLRSVKISVIAILTLFISLISCTDKTKKNAEQACSVDLDVSTIFNEYASREKKPIVDLDFNQPIHSVHVKRDMKMLQYILEEASPALYRYQSKVSVDSLFDAKICELETPTTYLDFVRDIAEVFTFMACGHSGWSHTPTYKNYRNDSMFFFPLKIYAYEDQYFIHQNGSFNQNVQEGDEILSINGTSPKAINETLMKYMGKDGESGLNGRTGISQYFKMAYSNFIGNPQNFELVCQNRETKTSYKVSLEALKLSTIDSILNANYELKNAINPPLNVQIDDTKNQAIYTIKSFTNEYLDAFNQNFITYTDSVFDLVQAQGVKNLIIDLRGNTGGWTANGRYLYSYFADHPLAYINQVEFNSIDSFSFAPIVLRDNGIEDTMSFELNEKGAFEWTNYHVLAVSPAPENRFNGQVYILIDDFTRSCSVMFSGMMRSHTDAIFIGEETGGAQCGSNGMVMSVQLPYTGIVVGLSTAEYELNVKNTDNSRGIIPDHVVKTTWEDFISNRDPQMDFTINLINSN